MGRRTRVALLLLLGSSAAWAGNGPAAPVGERIYLTGLRENGRPVSAVYSTDVPLRGSKAACVNCHRPSGLGTSEGGVRVPPISGLALFGSENPVRVRYDRGSEISYSTPHAPYTDAEVVRLIREGVAPDGHVLGPLMPRFSLNDEEAASVVSYLHGLSTVPSPGVDGTVVRLATVIDEQVDPARRDAAVRMLQVLVSQANAASAPVGPRHRLPIMERRMGVHPRFELDVWTVSGPRDTWRSQLAQRQARRPVFALLSGVASDWSPMQQFCEEESVVCWFPSVQQLPAGAMESRFSLYFGAGIAMEARALGTRLAKSGHILQIVGDSELGRRGGEAFLASVGVEHRGRVRTVGLGDAANALQSMERDALLVLWLTPDEIRSLTLPSRSPQAIYLSSTLGSPDVTLFPQSWQSHAFAVQEEELPPLRSSNINRLKAWLAGSGTPLVDERLQSEVYLAGRFLFSSVHALMGNYYPAHLVERAEMMLGDYERMLVSEELQSLQMAPMNKRPKVQEKVAASDPMTESLTRHLEEQRARGGTTVYPRLSLGPGQRVAAKGAYLVPLTAAEDARVRAEWVVP